MRITLLTIGAMGDTQPFVALAVRLKQQGDQVKLAARPDFASSAAEYGVEDAPLGRLFPQMAAVLHHGGAGTTGAGLRSGVPSIITPFTVDQPSWARHVHALGVGPAPIPYKTLTAERLANAIREAVSNREVRQRAAKVGQKIQAEDGLSQTIALMHQYHILS